MIFQISDSIMAWRCARLDGLKLFSRVTLSTLRKKSTWARNRDKAFGKYLIITNTVSSGLLMALGDLVQQQLEYLQFNQHADSFDWNRNKHMSFVGFFQGPLTHVFYHFLDNKLPGVGLTTIAKKITLDQLIASPFCIVLFFCAMNYLDGKNFEVSKNELKAKFLTVYATDCCVWIPSQFCNFYWIRPKYRVLYINLVTMCYNVFLSFIKHVEE